MLLLRIASAVEATSLVVLLVNLFTVHAKPVTAFGGPLHGISYVAVIAAAAMLPAAAATGARWRAFVPGIGGLLAVRALRGEAHDA
ncbi:hypothetical protein [Nonomuraea typhae]|uniref:hypothetical protein n=1 Tax=Nonomuraea typhae TaxID=2603600 RepID=UPI0012F8B453|nr:hypothetical protein [Nonomuraea typhae]